MRCPNCGRILRTSREGGNARQICVYDNYETERQKRVRKRGQQRLGF